MFELTRFKRTSLLAAAAAASGSIALYLERNNNRPAPSGSPNFPTFVWPTMGESSNTYHDGVWEVDYLGQSGEISRAITVACLGHTLMENVTDITYSVPEAQPVAKDSLYAWPDNRWCKDSVFSTRDLKTPFSSKPTGPDQPKIPIV